MATLSKYQKSLLGLRLSNAIKNLVTQGQSTTKIIERLADLGYSARASTIAALAQFWKSGQTAANILNRKNDSTRVFTKSVPTRVAKPTTLRVSFEIMAKLKDGSKRTFYVNEMDSDISVTRGEIFDEAIRKAQQLIYSHYEIQTAAIYFTSVVGI